MVMYGELFVIQITEEGNMELIVSLFPKTGGDEETLEFCVAKWYSIRNVEGYSDLRSST